MNGLIITGISTDVGKTVASSIVAKALNADYWKPIEAGGSDTKTVRRLSGVHCHPPVYQFKHPVSPHYAAQLENRKIDPETLIPPRCKQLVIEGCGGVLTPYGEDHLGTLFTQWKLPWIVVSKHYLGNINHTLLTLAWLKSHNQHVLGVIFNGRPHAANEQFILSYAETSCLGHILPEKTLNRRRIEWYAQQFKETLMPSGTPLLKDKSTPTPSLL